MVWQPGVAGIMGEAEKPVPSILYSTAKPGIAITAGKENADAHVFTGVAKNGGAGNITTLTTLPEPHAAGANVPAMLPPQAAVNSYCACMV